MNLEELKFDLVRDEGLKLRPYRDTRGVLTVGVGRNLEDRGITRDEAMVMLDTDIAGVLADLDRNAPWWRGLSGGRQRALANMCFNLGWPRLAAFQRMLSALMAGDFETAAAESEDSLWARQVGRRAARIAQLIKEG